MTGGKEHWREPDLSLGGLSLWLHGRQFPDSDDYWDGNWLNATAEMRVSGARVEVHGAFVRAPEIASFADEAQRLHERLDGRAELRCLEPELHVAMEARALGHIEVRVSITPDQLTQSHRFEFEIDQSYLPPLLAACRAILAKFPVKASKDPT